MLMFNPIRLYACNVKLVSFTIVSQSITRAIREWQNVENRKMEGKEVSRNGMVKKRIKIPKAWERGLRRETETTSLPSLHASPS